MDYPCCQNREEFEHESLCGDLGAEEHCGGCLSGVWQFATKAGPWSLTRLSIYSHSTLSTSLCIRVLLIFCYVF